MILDEQHASGASRRSRLAGLAIALAVCAACGSEPADQTPAPPAEGVVLEVDGLRFTRAEVEDFDEYFDELDPTLGHGYRTRELLARYLIPLKLARRAFPTERDHQRELARALREVADNSLQLEHKAPSGGFLTDVPVTRNSLPFPVARFAFRLENLGLVSPPIETPRGYVLIAGKDIEQGVTTVADVLTAYVVPFDTHPAGEFDRWLGEAKTGLAGKVTYVHPDFRNALPRYLEPRVPE